MILGADFAKVAVKDSLHDGLSAMYSALLYKTQLAVFVHVLSKSADERFIGFDFGIRTAQFRRATKRSVVQCSAKPLEHKPCRLLSNAKRAVNLHAGNAVLAVDQHPERCHPFVQSNRRILENRLNLDSELAVTATAEPQFARLDEVVAVGATARADHLAIGPAQHRSVLESPVGICEVDDRFLEGPWRFHG